MTRKRNRDSHSQDPSGQDESIYGEPTTTRDPKTRRAQVPLDLVPQRSTSYTTAAANNLFAQNSDWFGSSSFSTVAEGLQVPQPNPLDMQPIEAGPPSWESYHIAGASIPSLNTGGFQGIPSDVNANKGISMRVPMSPNSFMHNFLGSSSIVDDAFGTLAEMQPEYWSLGDPLTQ